MQKVVVTGGAGYVGSLLVPQLLAAGYQVLVYDICYFGHEFLPVNNPNMQLVKADIRDLTSLRQAFKGADSVISLACISNDASFELDEKLSTSVNMDAFEPMVIAAKEAGVKRFIYASSSSVYGYSEASDVTEDHPLVPLTLYNKYKGLCEPLLFKHMSDDFVCVTIRPATICGFAPRMRLDLSVNILTNHAITNRKIKVFGGSQLRPNLHIQDMCSLYKLLLEIPKEKIQGETFNAGYQNHTIMDIAKMVQSIVLEQFTDINEIPISVESTNDIRSYHINSDKITRQLGFKPALTVEDAVRDLCIAFKENKIINSMNNDSYYNVRQLKKLEVA